METNKVKLENKYFSIDFKHNILSAIIINTVGLLVFFTLLFLIFNRFYSAFERDNKLSLSYHLNNEISQANNSSTNLMVKKTRMKRIIDGYLKDKYIISIWISGTEGLLMFHSSENIQAENPNIKEKNYNSVFQHNWSFNPDGAVIPLVKDKVTDDFSEVFYPVYNNDNKSISFISGIRFQKFFSKTIFIPKLNIYVNLFYVIIISSGLFITFFIVLLITLLSMMRYDKNYRRSEELLTRLFSFDLKELPLQFDYNKNLFRKNVIVNFVNYINHLLESVYNHLAEEKEKQRNIQKVLLPTIFKSGKDQDKMKVVVKPDQIDLKQFLWEFYFKEMAISDITNYTTGVYHYYKERNSDLIFKYFNISDNKKSFFIGQVVDPDPDSKILLFSLLNFLLDHYKEKISQPGEYLAHIDNIINRIGLSELRLHACYAVLNAETDHIQIASTNFSPVIHYKAETGESSFYEFKSIPLGKKGGDDFLKNLNKESFKLSEGDTIVIPDSNIEKAANYDKDKFEIYRVSEIIDQHKDASADVIADKIKSRLNKFSVDFTKLNDLFVLVIKKKMKNE